MPPKTATRSATKHNTASSPPKANAISSQMSGRTTRATRSQSIELGGSDVEVPRKRGGRASRLSSVDSAGSSASAASSRASISRKTIRRTIAPAGRNLSIVAETREEEDSEEDEQEDIEAIEEDEIEEEDVDGHDPDAEEDDDEEDATARAHRSQSIGGISVISGTTAYTSHSQQMASNIDPFVVELLPELFESAWKLSNTIAPRNCSFVDYEGVLRDLKVHDSRRIKHFRIQENVFQPIYDQFVTSEDYINGPAILRRLLGPQEGWSQPFRPDPAIQAANLANLLKGIVALQPENGNTLDILSGLDLHFPKPFMSSFEAAVIGSSKLLKETFDVGLEIRTQCALITLSTYRNDPSVDLESFLVARFFSPPPEKGQNITEFEDRITNWSAIPIIEERSLTGNEVMQIRNRVRQIRKSFNQSEAAKSNGDIIDFETLNFIFSWAWFQWKLARWARLRLDEISTIVEQQGGIEDVTRRIVESMKDRDSQIDVEYSPPASVFTARTRTVDELISSGQSLYEVGGKCVIQQMEDRKKMFPSAPRPKQPEIRRLASVPPEEINEDLGDDFVLQDFNDVVDTESRADELANDWWKEDEEKDKENRPAFVKKKRMLDRQENAQRATWDSQDDAGPSGSKRIRAETEVDSDDDFQTDQRVPKPARRNTAPTSGQLQDDGADERPSPPKRARQQENLDDAESEEKDDMIAAIRKHKQAHRRQNTPGTEVEEIEDDETIPPPTFEQVSIIARDRASRSRAIEVVPQKRNFWSQADTEHLIYQIGTYGCAWSAIEKAGGFEIPRHQVALKDKARNIKVNYEITQRVLPKGMEWVRLGKKEIEAVRKVRPDYEQL